MQIFVLLQLAEAGSLAISLGPVPHHGRAAYSGNETISLALTISRTRDAKSVILDLSHSPNVTMLDAVPPHRKGSEPRT